MTASVTASPVLYLGPLRILKENIYPQDDVKQPNLSPLLMFPRQPQGLRHGCSSERRYSKGKSPQEFKASSDCIDQISEWELMGEAEIQHPTQHIQVLEH